MVTRCKKCNEPIEDEQRAVEILFGEWSESESLIESPEYYNHYHEECWRHIEKSCPALQGEVVRR